MLNGSSWLDTDGHPIQAHGGGILKHEGTYYWYGENKDGETREAYLHRVDVVGISCYSSSNLTHWKNEGVVLSSVPGDPTHDLHPSKVVERPKVLFCPNTQQFVMWLHIDHEDYSLARVGVAVSDTPTGPFHYLYSFQPNGLESRDFTVFQDGEQAFLYFSSDWNATLRVVRLNRDFLTVEGKTKDVFVNRYREAPTVFRHENRYFMMTSGCSGWDPNPTEYAVAQHPLGPWTTVGNPCHGEGAETTFQAQPTFALVLDAVRGEVVLMCDRWYKENLRDSKYIWLQMKVHGDTLVVHWAKLWTAPLALKTSGENTRADSVFSTK